MMKSTVMRASILFVCGSFALISAAAAQVVVAGKGVDPIGSHLRDAVRLSERAQPALLVRTMQRELRDARMAVELQVDTSKVSSEQLRRDLSALKAVQLLYLSDDGRWARIAVADLNVLDELAVLPWLESAQYAPPPLLRRGAADSRAGRALRSEQLASAYSVDGAGQAIGIISDSFAHTLAVRDSDTTPDSGSAGVLMGSRPQDSGDLPPSVRLLNDNSRDGSGNLTGTDEGAAMAELIYDIAPGAALLFHSAGGSRQEFADAIRNLCNNGATVVVDDVLFLTEGSYQDDLPAIAAKQCVAAGTPYLSAVGNDGDQGHRFVYSDGNPVVDDQPPAGSPPSGDDLHNWAQNGDDRFMAITVAARQQIYVLLNWNQPNASVNSGAGAQIDLDLYATTVASVEALDIDHPGFYGRSINAQGSTGQPRGDAVEFLLLEAGANDTTFYLAVDHYAGSQEDIPQQTGVPLEFRLLYTAGSPIEIEYGYNAPASWGHTLADGIAAVAAVPWWESPEFAPGSYTTVGIDPEPFTSRGGPQTVQFDSRGNYLPSERRPPQFAAVDGNNTTFLGSPSSSAAPEDGEPDDFRNFFGTSAAAPNAAAVFALLQEAFPAATPAELIAAVRDSATDVDGFRAAVGEDDVSGSGLLNASAAGVLLEQRVGTEGPPPSNSGGESGSSAKAEDDACFIATAAYGSFLAEEVELLRHFRDQVLLRAELGRQFVRLYYRYSPPLAAAIAEREWAKRVVRAGLLPLVLTIRYPLGSAAALGLILGLLVYRRQPAVAGKALNPV